jgi:hypothetical protein
LNIDLEKIIALDKTHFAIKQLSECVFRTAQKFKNNACEMITIGNTEMAILNISHAIKLDSGDWTLYLKRFFLAPSLIKQRCATL